MADEKKPKIDLKARLGKAGGQAVTPPPPGVGAMPVPLAPNTPDAPPPPIAAAPIPVAVPAPPGMTAPAITPIGYQAPPFAAPQSAPSVPPAPVRPQTIEVVESTIREARKGGLRQGLISGAAVGIVLGVVGYVAGGSAETGKARSQSVQHASTLATEVATSRRQLDELAKRLEGGRNMLAKDRKFPDKLASELSSINVDFDGAKLAGVRFSGFKQETASGLIEYVSAVQSTNDRKNSLMGLLGKLQKPITEALAAQGSDKAPQVNYVVLLNRDSGKNVYGVLAKVQKPFDLSAQMPAEYTAFNPISGQNVTAPKFAQVDKPGAAYLDPRSVSAAFPSETAGQVAQLAGQISRLISDIRGEAPQAGEAITEPKPGLIERADRLAKRLGEVK